VNVIAEITPSPSEVHILGLEIWCRVAAYTIGLVGSATAVGAIAGAIGSAVRATVLLEGESSRLWALSIALIAFAYGLHELNIVRLPMPQVRWQVPAFWSTYGKVAQALFYGAVLGAEIFTLIL
jgi:sulfite exporter TauE/SafE